MKTKSRLSSMLFFVCLGCPASQPKDIQESKNNVSESSVSPATTPIEPNKSTYDEPQKVVPAPTPVKDSKNNDNFKTAGIIGAGALGIGALYLAHKKLTSKAKQDLKNSVHDNPNYKKDFEDIENPFHKYEVDRQKAEDAIKAAAPAINQLKQKHGFLDPNLPYTKAANTYFDWYRGTLNRYVSSYGILMIDQNGKYYYHESSLLDFYKGRITRDSVKLEVIKMRADAKKRIQETTESLIVFNEQLTEAPKDSQKTILSLISNYEGEKRGYEAFLETIENL